MTEHFVMIIFKIEKLHKSWFRRSKVRIAHLSCRCGWSYKERRDDWSDISDLKLLADMHRQSISLPTTSRCNYIWERSSILKGQSTPEWVRCREEMDHQGAHRHEDSWVVRGVTGIKHAWLTEYEIEMRRHRDREEARKNWKW